MTIEVAQKGGLAAFIANTTRKAYDKETFASLVECCSRLFCCDEEIAITDLLLAAEKAISERDIEAELGISERRVHEFLVRLERHGLVNRVTTGHAADIYSRPQRQHKSAREGAAPQQQQGNTQSFWRLSSYFIIVVHYKLSKMEEILQQRRRSLNECDRFVCPGCKALYDSLEVQKLEMDGFDAHFICYCGSKVELDDKETKDSIYSSQQQRCEEQVKTLKKCLTAAWGMEVPSFPVYSKSKEKAAEKSDAQTNEAAASTVGGSSSAVSGYSGTSDGSNTTTMRPVVKSLLSEMVKQPMTAFSGRSETGKIKFHMRGASTKQSTATNIASDGDHQANNTPTVRTPKSGESNISMDEGAGGKASQDTDSVEQEDDIMFYIDKLGRSFTLSEAQDHQKHMNNEEFERFLELQERYLNFF
ncbi:hypothetical protein BgAZ_201120 [Babesia gibsoni]|uniref:Uncharacterized protein n=1 Tax=Babesia gibsoni TaxID=33632 RepID=A0AAD8PE53_BABGI|nr:hypothetical protein BgAZ_201120 [Babesia gibsoni]